MTSPFYSSAYAHFFGNNLNRFDDRLKPKNNSFKRLANILEHRQREALSNEYELLKKDPSGEYIKKLSQILGDDLQKLFKDLTEEQRIKIKKLIKSIMIQVSIENENALTLLTSR